MDLQERIDDAQRQANNLAIQESNLRAQLEQVAQVKHQLRLVVAEKNKFIGIIMALQSLVEAAPDGDLGARSASQ